MTITFHPMWLHLGVTTIFLVALLWAVEPKSDYDFGVGFRALAVTLGYAVYWIVYLALT